MRTCPKCSLSNSNSATHCRRCGTPLPPLSPTASHSSSRSHGLEIDDPLGDVDSALSALFPSEKKQYPPSKQQFSSQERYSQPSRRTSSENSRHYPTQDYEQFYKNTSEENATEKRDELPEVPPSPRGRWAQEKTEVSHLDPEEWEDIIQDALKKRPSLRLPERSNPNQSGDTTRYERSISKVIVAFEKENAISPQTPPPHQPEATSQVQYPQQTSTSSSHTPSPSPTSSQNSWPTHIPTKTVQQPSPRRPTPPHSSHFSPAPSTKSSSPNFLEPSSKTGTHLSLEQKDEKSLHRPETTEKYTIGDWWKNLPSDTSLTETSQKKSSTSPSFSPSYEQKNFEKHELDPISTQEALDEIEEEIEELGEDFLIIDDDLNEDTDALHQDSVADWNQKSSEQGRQLQEEEAYDELIDLDEEDEDDNDPTARYLIDEHSLSIHRPQETPTSIISPSTNYPSSIKGDAIVSSIPSLSQTATQNLDSTSEIHEDWFDAFSEQDSTAKQTPPVIPQTSRDEESEALSLLWLQLEVEQGQQEGRRRQEWTALTQLHDNLTSLLKKSQLPIFRQEKNFIATKVPSTKQQLDKLIQVASQALHLVLETPIEHQETWLHLRCTVTTALTNLHPDPVEHTLKLAKQLLSAMPNNQLWLDWTTYQRLQKSLLCDEVVLPNIEEPAYELSWSTLTSLDDSSNDEPFCDLQGRRQFFDTLENSWRKTTYGEFQLLLFSGEPGIGRTRLLQEWSKKLNSQALQFWAGNRWTPPKKVASPYLTSLFRSHVQKHQLSQYSDLYQHIASLAQKAQEYEQEWQEKAAILLDIANDEQVEQQDLQRALSWFINLATRTQPVLIVIDDLFLIDRHSRSFLEQFLLKKPRRMMIVVLSSSGEYENLLNPYLKNTIHIDITPLSEEESRQLLLHHAPQLQQVPPSQLHQIIREAEGNPRILLALARKLLSQRQESIEETWRNNIPLPTSVESLLLQRIRHLSALEQDTLRKAAVIGDLFWQNAIESLERMELSEGSWNLRAGIFVSMVDDRSDILKQLEQHQLIKRSSAAHSPFPTFTFRQRLLRQVLLRQIPRSIRQQMHQRIAEWLKLNMPDTHYRSQLIEHLKQACEFEKAAQYLRQLGEKALKNDNYTKALSFFSDALEYTGEENPSSRLQNLHDMVVIYTHLGDHNAAIHLSETALQLSWKLTSMRWGGQFYALLATPYIRQGEFSKAEDILYNAQTLSTKSTDYENILEIEKKFLELALHQANLDKAREHLANLNINDDSPIHPKHRIDILLLHAWFLRLEGRWNDSLEQLESSSDLAQKHGLNLHYALALAQQGELQLLIGDEEMAQSLLEKAIELLRQHQAYFHFVATALNLAHTYLFMRNAQKALQILEEAWEIHQAHGQSLFTSRLAATLAATYSLSRHHSKMAEFAQLAEKTNNTSSPLAKAMTYHLLGETCAGLPLPQAQSLFRQIPAKLPEGGAASFFFIKSLESYEKIHEKGRYSWALLGLSRALFASQASRAAKHVLERGLRETEAFHLVLLLERFQNQHRLIQQDVNALPFEYPNQQSQSTLVVRKPRSKKPRK